MQDWVVPILDYQDGRPVVRSGEYFTHANGKKTKPTKQIKAGYRRVKWPDGSEGNVHLVMRPVAGQGTTRCDNIPFPVPHMVLKNNGVRSFTPLVGSGVMVWAKTGQDPAPEGAHAKENNGGNS